MLRRTASSKIEADQSLFSVLVFRVKQTFDAEIANGSFNEIHLCKSETPNRADKDEIKVIVTDENWFPKPYNLT